MFDDSGVRKMDSNESQMPVVLFRSRTSPFSVPTCLVLETAVVFSFDCKRFRLVGLRGREVFALSQFSDEDRLLRRRAT